jgi:dTDP-glucose 4,6-dehydratase/UDP-glucose 4,6-dehydratase
MANNENGEEDLAIKEEDWNPSVLLLTGIAGFIGSNVITYLVMKYPNIHFIGLDKMSYCSDLRNLQTIWYKPNFEFYGYDLLDEGKMNEIFSSYQIDGILHFAAYTHVDRSFGNSLEFTKNNILGTHVLLEFAKTYSIKRFIHVSTDEVYGSSDHLSTENSILDPTNPYSATKAGAEHLVRAYFHSFKLPIIITRGNNVYGPQQYPEKVIPRFALQLLQGSKISIQGSGDQKRSFLHVDDVARAFETILFKGEIGQIYNIGSEKEWSILEVADRMIDLLQPANKDDPKEDQQQQREKWINWVEDRHFNDHRYFISSQKLESLGWKQEVSFDQGLEKTIEWYRQRQDWWPDLFPVQGLASAPSVE